MLHIQSGQSQDFEASFREALAIIASMKGYVIHELPKCIEEKDQYLLLVKWKTLQAHTVGFRGSAEYQEWKRLLHYFYDPIHVVEHFENVNLDWTIYRERHSISRDSLF